MTARRRGRDARTRLTELRDAYLFGGVPAEMKSSDIDRLLRFAGMSPIWAKRAAIQIAAEWQSLVGARSPADFRHVVNQTLGGLAVYLPDTFVQKIGEVEHGPRPLPPVRQDDPVRINPHGTVHRGRIERDAEGQPIRPHIFIWLERAAAAPCGEYAWYQFVHPSIWVGPVGQQLRDRTRNLDNPTIESGTGLNVTLCRWNPDYQADEIKAMEKQSGRKLPEFTPPGRALRQSRPAKPYLSRPIPNEDGQVGLVDAPDWCSRGRDKEGQVRPSPIERMWRQIGGRDCLDHVGPPPEGQERVEIRMEFRSYLVCLDDMRCVGFQNWRAVSAATLTYGWQLDRSRPPEAGIVGADRPQHWCTTLRIDDIAYSLTIDDWEHC